MYVPQQICVSENHHCAFLDQIVGVIAAVNFYVITIT